MLILQFLQISRLHCYRNINYSSDRNLLTAIIFDYRNRLIIGFWNVSTLVDNDIAGSARFLQREFQKK